MDGLDWVLLGTTVLAGITAVVYWSKNAKLEHDSGALTADLNRQIDRKTSELSLLRTQVATLNSRIESQSRLIQESDGKIVDFQNQINANGQAAVDTNVKLQAHGKAIVALKAAIKKVREAGKVGPKARQDLNAAVDRAIDDVFTSAPLKVEANK